MKYCGFCGQVMNDFDSFCNNCGNAAVDTPDLTPDDVAIAEEIAFLYDVRRFIKYERISWKISAIVFTVCAGIFALLGMLICIAGLSVGGYGGYYLAFFGTIYLIFGAAMYTTIAVIGFVMIKKCDKYNEFVDIGADVEPTIKRAGDVGMIVFSALFNAIAMIFIIINFVRIKSHPYIVSRIINRRKVN